MCGIAGILRFDKQPVNASAVETILNKISHRGKDHCGIVTSEDAVLSANIGLGHRRLSIIDLNESGAQPMFYADNKLCITYNGEIYNYLELKKFLENKSYTFKTNTDTEVLLAAYHYWGKACVRHLNGMFAFAIWDEKEKQLFCARDPMGIKPFYYFHSADVFAFSSESLALAHLNKGVLSEQAVISYLLSMYIATNESIYAGIKKLPPGHSLILNENGNQVSEKFWSVDSFQQLDSNDVNLENLKLTLEKAVQRQLQSDVPVGGFLSGGIDSGLITALAAPQCKKYFTYSAGYEGLLNNELFQAKLIAERYGTQHTEVMITADDAMLSLDKALEHLSEPVADPSIVATYLLSQLAAGDGVKVLLNGTGGDEVFGGYTRYTGQLSLKRKLLAAFPPFLKKSISFLPLNHKIKSRLQNCGLDMLYSTGGSYALASQLKHHGKIFIPFLKKLGKEFNSLLPKNIPLLYQQMLFDLQVYMPDQLLYLLDQMTMAHTIEGRVPLLDVDLIKLAFQFFAKEHVRDGQTKAILKSLARPHLGQESVDRKKQGFAGSSSWWVRENYQDFLEVIVEAKSLPFFENFNIDKLTDKSRLNETQTNDIFILYCFSKWYSHVKPMLMQA
jgi:asparagine synthase (glutamine-hydrolysing)